MKKIGLTTVLFVFLLFHIIGVQGQTNRPQLNQVELMKQWIGTWKTDNGQGATGIHELKYYGTGLVAYIMHVDKDTVAVQLFGYDKEIRTLMSSVIPGYEYDIFISYRQNDSKHDGWLIEFVENFRIQ